MVVTNLKDKKMVDWELNLENKSIEELEKEIENQKEAQNSLIKKINEQWYKEEWDKERILNFDKNINLIYWKIKEMKKSV